MLYVCVFVELPLLLCVCVCVCVCVLLLFQQCVQARVTIVTGVCICWENGG